MGDSGDNAHFFAYASADLISSDTASEGNAFKMKLFWENYSGSMTGSILMFADDNYNQWDKANYFGYCSLSGSTGSETTGSKHPLPQAIFASINNIPAPSMYDINHSFT